MAKGIKQDLRVINNAPDRSVAMADPRMPIRVDTLPIDGQDWKMSRPKDLPGMNGRKIRNQDQLKEYIKRIPASPRDTR